MCTLLKRSKNTSEKRSPLSGRTKLGFSQINPEEFVVLPSGEKAPKEEGLHPGEKGRPTDLARDGQMDPKEDRLPRRNPQGIPKPLPLGRGEGARSQETGERRQQEGAGTGRDGDAAKKTEDRRSLGTRHSPVITLRATVLRCH